MTRGMISHTMNDRIFQDLEEDFNVHYRDGLNGAKRIIAVTALRHFHESEVRDVNFYLSNNIVRKK